MNRLLSFCACVLPALAAAAPAINDCDPYSGPPLAALHAYEGLMHEHSAYSDGDIHSIPADYFRIARDSGYDFTGASEHSDNLDTGVFLSLSTDCFTTPDNFLTCLTPNDQKLAKWRAMGQQAQDATRADFLAIRGFEWTSDRFGHINVYFSKNFANAKTDLGYLLTMETFWAWFTRAPNRIGLGGSLTSPLPMGGGADGLAHFNHPHDKCLLNGKNYEDPGCDWNDFRYVPAAAERMFGIEAYNSGNRDDRYLPYLARALDRGWRLSFLGSEDEHHGLYASEERPKTVTLASGLSEDAFKQAWLARRTYALSPGQHLRVNFNAAGHPMGDQLTCAAGSLLRLSTRTLEASGAPFAGSLQLFGDGGVELARRDGASGNFLIHVASGRHWYFVRVHGADGQSAAYLAPVWVTGR